MARPPAGHTPPPGAYPTCQPDPGPCACHPGGMRRPHPVTAVLLAGAVLLPAASVLAGCGAGAPAQQATAAATASTPGGVTQAATPPAGVTASGSPFRADVRPDTADPVNPAGLTVTAVRSGVHLGFERVVFELTGHGAPGWSVEYVDRATAEGTGAPVGLVAPAYLRVVLRGTSYPYETGATELGRGPVPLSGTTAVTGAFYDGTFEGQSLAYVGVRGQAPFRVYALDAPSRVVVDVGTS